MTENVKPMFSIQKQGGACGLVFDGVGVLCRLDDAALGPVADHLSEVYALAAKAQAQAHPVPTTSDILAHLERWHAAGCPRPDGTSRWTPISQQGAHGSWFTCLRPSSKWAEYGDIEWPSVRLDPWPDPTERVSIYEAIADQRTARSTSGATFTVTKVVRASDGAILAASLSGGHYVNVADDGTVEVLTTRRTPEEGS